jgi:hypothetical protein
MFEKYYSSGRRNQLTRHAAAGRRAPGQPSVLADADAVKPGQGQTRLAQVEHQCHGGCWLHALAACGPSEVRLVTPAARHPAGRPARLAAIRPMARPGAGSPVSPPSRPRRARGGSSDSGVLRLPACAPSISEKTRLVPEPGDKIGCALGPRS